MADRADGRAIGTVTRGTTNTNRLRRVDRWLAAQPVLRRIGDPLVVDLGYGASPVTVLELQRRMSRHRPDVEVLGLEIDPARVHAARRHLRRVRAAATPFAPDARVGFDHGGFEVPLPPGRVPAVIRAFNVLRQYAEAEVSGAWELMRSRLHSGGIVIEGTCDELGRVSSWITLDVDGPRSLTLSLRLAGVQRPSIVAERLPKALIHRNVPGERVHALMTSLDRAWTHAAPLSVYGPEQRWVATVKTLRAEGWPMIGGKSRWRLGELTVAWECVAPR